MGLENTWLVIYNVVTLRIKVYYFYRDSEYMKLVISWRCKGKVPKHIYRNNRNRLNEIGKDRAK